MDDKDFSERLDEVFSRRVVGATALGVGVGKIIEYCVVILSVGATAERMAILQGYLLAFIIGLIIYMYWNRLEGWIERLFWNNL